MRHQPRWERRADSGLLVPARRGLCSFSAAGPGFIGGRNYKLDVVALLHFDGSNGSTTITDATGKRTWSTVSSAALSTAQFKFGTASLNLTGGSDCVTTAASSDFAFGTGDFTIEGFVYPRSYNGNTIRILGTTQAQADFAFEVTSSGNLNYYRGPTTSGSYNFGGSVPLNAWTHVAVCRVGGQVRGFIGGTQVGSTMTDTVSLANVNSVIVGAGSPNGTTPSYVDEIRITKSHGWYTANFTPPAAPFTYP